MTLRLRAQCATVLLALHGALAWPDDSPTKGVRHPLNDRSGDPLPPGATMRLGTVRFRHAPFIKHVVYSPDGQLVLTDDETQTLQIWDARTGKNLRSLDIRVETVRDFACSPDGKTIAAVGFQYDRERNLMVDRLTFTELGTGRLVRQVDSDGETGDWKIGYSPDGKFVAITCHDGTFRLHDAATAKLLHQVRIAPEGSPPPIAFSPAAESNLLAIACGRTIRLWDCVHRREIRRLAILGEHAPIGLAFSPDGASLAAAGGAEISLWRVSDGTLSRPITRLETTATHVSFSPDGTILAATGRGQPPVLVDLATGNFLDRFTAIRVDGPMSFSPDGKTFAATSERQALHFWDVATGNDRLATPDAHSGTVGALAFLPDGRTLISGSYDRSVRVWDLATGRQARLLPHTGWVRSLSVSTDGFLLAAGESYPGWGLVRLWNLKSGELIRGWFADRAILRGVRLSRNDKSVIAALSDGSIRLWDNRAGGNQPLPNGGNRLSEVNDAVFSRDGQSLALIGKNAVQVVDIAHGEPRFTTLSRFSACTFAPDGRSLAIARRGIGRRFELANREISVDNTTAASTILWLDSRTGHVRREIEIPESTIKCLAFSPDGATVAAGILKFHPQRGLIRIFRLRDKAELETFDSPCPWIESLAFAPDGERIAAGLLDTSIVIWDVGVKD